MKPKARKFRIKRTGSGRAEQVADNATSPEDEADAHLRDMQNNPTHDAVEENADEQIAAIRKEGLTGRQLRMARRLAQRHGLVATSDYDAVRLLRANGIDPFRRANMLELVVEGGAANADGMQLPQTVPLGDPQLPSTEVQAEDARAGAIHRIQRDIARRRRRKLQMLFVRLAFFVVLPTVVAGYYYYVLATPLYATKSEFVIQQAQPAGGAGGGIGGLLSGTQFATSQDSITVQSYLQSRDAMLRLDEDHDFKAHFSDPDLDPILRLAPDASNEAAYRLYERLVKIGYDPTEGIIKMEVSATDPAVSATFSRELITYAEDIVDNLSQRLREDQMQGARESYEKAEEKMREAQQRVIELQEDFDVISTEVEVTLLTSRISSLEQLLTQDQLSLEELLSNSRPNPARVEPLQRRIENLQETIADLRSQLTQGTSDDVSLARVGSELAVAQADLETRNLLLQQSLQQLETARIEANRQTRYLSTGVTPVAPDEPTYPRAFENTVLAFLIFAGIYLMASLTASILREQVSS